VSFLYNASAGLRTERVDIWYDKLHLCDSASRVYWYRKETVSAHLSSGFLTCIHLYWHTTRPWHQEFQKTTFEQRQNWILDSKLEATQKNDIKRDKREDDKEEQAPITPFRGMHKQGQLRGQPDMGGTDQIENPASNGSFLYWCMFIHCHRNVFMVLLPNSGCSFFHYSGLQPSCHNIFMLFSPHMWDTFYHELYIEF
jgi:hypothetical protein